jgi:NADPH-dependent 2,4-dienoyl-CoA reductase/sulfur reductase-like enzyme
VLVIGGGPAGMEAARIAALRGHRVTLAEAGPRLGGAVQVARLAPRHEGIGDAVDWLEAEMERRGVTVLLDTWVTTAFVETRRPDVVILATGSSPRMDGVQSARPDHRPAGVKQDHVVSTAQLLTGRHNQVGGTALVLDDVGGYEAIGAAEFLVNKGATVTYVTTKEVFAPRMITPGVAQPALERLTREGRFRLVTKGYLKDIGAADSVIGSLEGWTDMTVAAETVVLVTPNRPNSKLAEEIEALGIQVLVVGDALEQAFLPHAFRTANLAARSI